MSRTNNRDADRPRHEPTDPDIAEAMRDRRIELGLTVQEIAERARFAFRVDVGFGARYGSEGFLRGVAFCDETLVLVAF